MPLDQDRCSNKYDRIESPGIDPDIQNLAKPIISNRSEN